MHSIFKKEKQSVRMRLLENISFSDNKKKLKFAVVNLLNLLARAVLLEMLWLCFYCKLALFNSHKINCFTVYI